MSARGSVQDSPREPLSARERRQVRAEKRERDVVTAREAILNAAEEIFARDGFDGARVDAIAEASGYNKALIFHYFGDKLGLYREIVCMRRDQSELQRTEMILALTGDGQTPLTAEWVREFIETMVGWHFDHLVAHPHLQRIMAWEAAEGWGMLIEAKRGEHAGEYGGGQTGGQLGGQGADRDAQQLYPVWVEAIVAFVRRAQAEGLMRPEIDPYVAMAHVKSMVLIHLLSLPNYEATFRADFSSSEALRHGREQLISFAVHAFLTPAALPLSPVDAP